MTRRSNSLKYELEQDIITVQEAYCKKFKRDKKGVTRNFYRKNGKFKDIDYEQIYGSFKNFKNEVFEKYDVVTKATVTRDSIDVHINSRSKKGKYFITSIVAGAEISKKFMNTIENYCTKTNSKLILLVMRGIKVKDGFSEEIYKEYNKYFATKYTFNDNLSALDFHISPSQIIPITGLKRYGSAKGSLIIASTKQFLETIPNKKNKIPRLIMTTGTVSEPIYPTTRSGSLAQQDNLIGGIIVEVADSKIFHSRHVQADKQGGFQDLDKYYCGEEVKEIPAECITMEPHYGIEEPTSINETKEMIRLTGCRRLFIHDLIDLGSINYHDEKLVTRKFKRDYPQTSLKEELDHCGEELVEWVKEFPNLDIYIIKSNHDDFLIKWLNVGDFVKDPLNVYLGCELMQSVLRNENPLEYYLKKNFKELSKLKFLNENGLVINNIEWGIHGNFGADGRYGSKSSLELVNHKSVSSHTHSPSIYRGVYISGCDCKLIQEYNKHNSGSSWLHGNVIQYKNGNRQIVIKINDKWRLEE